jgi:hypothetical protein
VHAQKFLKITLVFLQHISKLLLAVFAGQRHIWIVEAACNILEASQALFLTWVTFLLSFPSSLVNF